MSELRSKYPQAQAWTFIVGDTAPSAITTAASRGKGNIRSGSSSGIATKAQQKNRKDSSRISDNSLGSLGHTRNREGYRGYEAGVGAAGSMGGLCSSKKSVANKENEVSEIGELGELGASSTAEEILLLGAARSDSFTSRSGDSAGSDPGRNKQALANINGGLDEERYQSTSHTHWVVADEDARPTDEQQQRLDSTAFLSPDSTEMGVKQGIIGDDRHAAGDEDMWFEQSDADGGIEDEGDRSSWLSHKLATLGAGRSVDVAQLKQVSGVEDCLFELLSDRARHLKAMETLTDQLRRGDAVREKEVHDLKALTTRLECVEQDKAFLEHRTRAAAEEHRTDHARWFVNKQELETRCVQLESRDTQYRASIRKKEMEYVKLQDNMRRVIQKDFRNGGSGSSKGSNVGSRGLEANFELSPGEALAGRVAPLGGVLNEQAKRKVDELEKENLSLRGMLVDLQADVVDLKEYHDRHGDLLSAGRANDEEDIWGGGGEDASTLPEEVIEGMPADWLQRQLGDETARQIMGMRGALVRVLGEGNAGVEDGSMSESDVMGLVSQLREARSLLREQDAIMLAAIFDRPGAEAAIAVNRQRCVCGTMWGAGDGSDTSDAADWLQQEKDELERERSRLERDKARFLEEAVRRDTKSFVYSGPPGSPGSPFGTDTGSTRDAGMTTPGHTHRHLGPNGMLKVPNSPSLPLMNFTPPAASPDTARLLGQLGIETGK